MDQSFFEELWRNDKTLETGEIKRSFYQLCAGLRLLQRIETDKIENSIRMEPLYIKDSNYKWTEQDIEVFNMNHNLILELGYFYNAQICLMGNFTEEIGALIESKLGKVKKYPLKKLSNFNSNIEEYKKYKKLKLIQSNLIENAKWLYKNLYKIRNDISHQNKSCPINAVSAGVKGSILQWPGKFTIDIKQIEEILEKLNTHADNVAEFILCNS